MAEIGRVVGGCDIDGMQYGRCLLAALRLCSLTYTSSLVRCVSHSQFIPTAPTHTHA